MPDSQQSSKITIATYDTICADYAVRACANPMDRQLSRFARYLPCSARPGGARVLDAGCGPGRDVARLGALGYRPIGLDRSWGMLGEARRRFRADWVSGDLRALPFASATFDGVWACASLLHLPKDEMPVALAEMRRVLGDGVLFVALKEGSGERWVTGQAGEVRFFAFYQLDELCALLQAGGYTILETAVEEDAAGRPERWLNVIARAR